MFDDIFNSKYAVKPDVCYEMQTTFWEDFTIADCFGENAVKDTFKRAFREWKNVPMYLTELVMVLNWKCWQRYDLHEKCACEMYRVMYEKAYDYAMKHLKGKDLQKFFEITD